MLLHFWTLEVVTGINDITTVYKDRCGAKNDARQLKHERVLRTHSLGNHT